MQELLPTLIAVNVTACEPAAGGAAQDIELDFGAGDGARILKIEWVLLDDQSAGNLTAGVSTDPNEAAPASDNALVISTSVIATFSHDAAARTADDNFKNPPDSMLSDEVIIVTRNLRVLGFSGVGKADIIYARVHYNQVKFSADELRAITIVNR